MCRPPLEVKGGEVVWVRCRGSGRRRAILETSSGVRELNVEFSPTPLSKFFETLESLLFAAWVVLLLRAYVVAVFVVPTPSMSPLIEPGDWLVGEVFSYRLGLRKVKRGDVVIFHPPIEHKKNLLFVKRVVGLPGEKVEVVNGKVFVNGKELKENYAVYEGEPLNGRVEVVLGRDQFFLMGDNRNRSEDSRFFGPVSKREILGKPLFRIFPLWRFGFLRTVADYDLQG